MTIERYLKFTSILLCSQTKAHFIPSNGLNNLQHTQRLTCGDTCSQAKVAIETRSRTSVAYMRWLSSCMRWWRWRLINHHLLSFKFLFTTCCCCSWLSLLCSCWWGQSKLCECVIQITLVYRSLCAVGSLGNLRSGSICISISITMRCSSQHWRLWRTIWEPLVNNNNKSPLRFKAPAKVKGWWVSKKRATHEEFELFVPPSANIGLFFLIVFIALRNEPTKRD